MGSARQAQPPVSQPTAPPATATVSNSNSMGGSDLEERLKKMENTGTFDTLKKQQLSEKVT